MNDDRTANLLGALALALADRMTDEAEARAELGAAAPAALVSLGVAPGTSIGALAMTIGLTHSATVRLVDRLAEAGLVERQGGDDKRVVGLRLTRKGAARRRAILAARKAVMATALSALPEDDQERLTGMIEVVLAHMVRSRRDADFICRLCDEEACPDDRCPVETAVQPT